MICVSCGFNNKKHWRNKKDRNIALESFKKHLIIDTRKDIEQLIIWAFLQGYNTREKQEKRKKKDKNDIICPDCNKRMQPIRAEWRDGYCYYSQYKCSICGIEITV